MVENGKMRFRALLNRDSLAGITHMRKTQNQLEESNAVDHPYLDPEFWDGNFPVGNTAFGGKMLEIVVTNYSILYISW